VKIRLLLASVVCGCLVTVVAVGQGNKQGNRRISASEAVQHIGEQVAVCGLVASSRYLSNSRSKPTFLNLGKSYPSQDFTVVIWPEDRAQFGHPEDTYLGKNICVSGEITSYRGKPQIVARYPSQIHEE
jgi:endonuclease G